MLQVVMCNGLQDGVCCAMKGDNQSGTVSAVPLQHLWQTGTSLTAAGSSLHVEQRLHSKHVDGRECRRCNREEYGGFISLVTVNCHEKQPLRLDNLEQLVKVAKKFDDHFFFSQLGARVISVCAIVDDSIHVKVKVVHKRGLSNIGWLVEQGISLAQPAVELWDACAKQHLRIHDSVCRDARHEKAGPQSAPITAVR